MRITIARTPPDFRKPTRCELACCNRQSHSENDGNEEPVRYRNGSADGTGQSVPANRTDVSGSAEPTTPSDATGRSQPADGTERSQPTTPTGRAVLAKRSQGTHEIDGVSSPVVLVSGHELAAIEREAVAQMQQLNDALRFAVSDANRLADQLAEALRWVRCGHYEEHHDNPATAGEFIYEGTCDACGDNWPCETVRHSDPPLAAYKEARKDNVIRVVLRDPEDTL